MKECYNGFEVVTRETCSVNCGVVFDAFECSRLVVFSVVCRLILIRPADRSLTTAQERNIELDIEREVLHFETVDGHPTKSFAFLAISDTRISGDFVICDGIRPILGVSVTSNRTCTVT